MKYLQGTSVLVLGLGTSGLAMARWCVRCGAQVTVWDNRPVVDNDQVLAEQLPSVTRIKGTFSANAIPHYQFDRVLSSPGLSPLEIESVRSAMTAKGIPFQGELALFLEALAVLSEQHNYQPKVLAITGTNGKTTVTTLTTHLLNRAGKSAAIAGNVGPSLLDTLGSAIDVGNLPEVWVLELSSFQLAGCTTFSPDSATVLNITQDHLDWHGSMQAYRDAKMAIFGCTTQRIVNRDDPTVAALAQPTPSVQAVKSKSHEKLIITIGSGAPKAQGDYGIETVNGIDWLVKANPTELQLLRRRKQEEPPVELTMQRLMPVEALQIRGRHNALNALTALALAETTGAPLSAMLFGLRDYRGEPHRMESIGIWNEVEYFDDSKGTNVGATVAAINSLGTNRKLVLILGGDGKGQDFSPLASPIREFARSVVLIGRDAPLLAGALANTDIPLAQETSLEQAVILASTLAYPGDAVLLSPACASLDMFQNYMHRGHVFRQAYTHMTAHLPNQVTHV